MVCIGARTDNDEEVAVKIVGATLNGLVFESGSGLFAELTISSTSTTSSRSRYGGPNASFPSSGNAAIVRSLS